MRLLKKVDHHKSSFKLDNFRLTGGQPSRQTPLGAMPGPLFDHRSDNQATCQLYCHVVGNVKGTCLIFNYDYGNGPRLLDSFTA